MPPRVGAVPWAWGKVGVFALSQAVLFSVQCLRCFFFGLHALLLAVFPEIVSLGLAPCPPQSPTNRSRAVGTHLLGGKNKPRRERERRCGVS